MNEAPKLQTPVKIEQDDSQFCNLCSRYENDEVYHAPIKPYTKEQVMPLLINLVAGGGMVLDEDGNAKKMSMEVFGHKVGYTRMSLYRWIDEDKRDFDIKVMQAMPAVYGNPRRIAKLMNAMFVEGAKGSVQAAEAYMRNFGKALEWKTPTTKLEHDVGNNLADLIAASQRKSKEAERKVIDADVNGD